MKAQDRVEDTGCSWHRPCQELVPTLLASSQPWVLGISSQPFGDVPAPKGLGRFLLLGFSSFQLPQEGQSISQSGPCPHSTISKPPAHASLSDAAWHHH